MSARRHDALEKLHGELLRSMPQVDSPDVLRSRGFLDSIYERANRDLERDLDPRVEAELRREFEAPEVEHESTALRALESTPAPGLLRPRVEADCRSWREEWMRRRRRSNILRASAAAVVVVAGLWAVSVFDKSSSQPTEDIVIVRQKVSQPFAPGFSRSAIFRELGAGGRDGR